MFVVPSRSRPHNIARLIAAWRATAAASPALVCVDADDPMLAAYRALHLPEDWTLRVGAREGLSALYNAALAARPGCAWYGVFADDVVPETELWDRVLIGAAGAHGLAWGDDGINGRAHATHFVVGGDLVRALGFLALPGLERLYIDTAWHEIARRRGITCYRPDVIVRHHHFSNGLAPFDATYRKCAKDADRRVFQAWRAQLDSSGTAKERTLP